MNKYSPTWISDNFPLSKLECQFFEECQFYSVKKCGYSDPCYTKRNYEGTLQSVRSIFRQVVEPFYSEENERFQIRLILDEHGKK